MAFSNFDVLIKKTNVHASTFALSCIPYSWKSLNFKKTELPPKFHQRSSRSQMLFKIGVLKDFTGKNLCCSLFLIKLQIWGQNTTDYIWKYRHITDVERTSSLICKDLKVAETHWYLVRNYIYSLYVFTLPGFLPFFNRDR